LAFLLLFLLLPLAAVFSEALRQGWHAYLDGLREPDAWSAIKLTLLTAVIAVPLNLVFGVAAAWCRWTRPARWFSTSPEAPQLRIHQSKALTSVESSEGFAIYLRAKHEKVHAWT